ncbi:hypothetical protein CONCODRAFT_12506 [Conidiobolus coronatus NRRL 28638]|uniref:F-box domain-containing protein n=1 Tax=Conidiobolus coronatus (strain ATCC 28846 / CBS 209.66 / NRRL 28638) TaxID=796925 RepID=A0A137NSU4_CONC2|nr:hypothetical protein CONCODRAFT_12506 [Conidiobolus coronatus NRRL 28638]|eukprot:KXN65801.1 hypothetical protein CONCODRAFT_12506 [Conidiobolus coronatus NRRL 28638]
MSQNKITQYFNSTDKQEPKMAKTNNKPVESKTKSGLSNDIWNLSFIMSEIFSYLDYKDLVEFNTACKKWNQLTYSRIHKGIKIFSDQYIENRARDSTLYNIYNIDREAEKCINNNAKYANLIKEFTLSVNLFPKRLTQFFETFKYLKMLTFNNVKMTEEQFVNVIKSLTRLEELRFEYTTITEITRKSIYRQPFQIPSTLKKLTIKGKCFEGNAEQFIETINSHSNLTEFTVSSGDNEIFLTPFLNHYPSLKVLDYKIDRVESYEVLYDIFEYNPQITVLRLGLKYLDDDFFSNVQDNLVDLEELCLNKQHASTERDSTVNQIFTMHTKIKKLELFLDNMSETSLDLIIKNCPELTDLKVQFPKDWRTLTKAIGARCNKLEKLTLLPHMGLGKSEMQKFYQELYEEEFLVNTHKYKDTINELTLSYFNFIDSKVEYFEQFTKLEKLNFLNQIGYGRSSLKIDPKIPLWPNYKVKTINNDRIIDVELEKC